MWPSDKMITPLAWPRLPSRISIRIEYRPFFTSKMQQWPVIGSATIACSVLII
jgi:hypothetical protein